MKGTFIPPCYVKESNRLNQPVESLVIFYNLLALKRPETTGESREVIGPSLIYSRKFLIQTEVDTFDVTRLQVGINPSNFVGN